MNYIAYYRKQAGLSQRKLAELCKFLPSRLSNYENNRRETSLKSAHIIVRVLQNHTECTFIDVFPSSEGISANVFNN